MAVFSIDVVSDNNGSRLFTTILGNKPKMRRKTQNTLTVSVGKKGTLAIEETPERI